MSNLVILRADMTMRAVLRRRLTVGILVAIPVAFYFVSHDMVGRSVRSLTFGMSWAVSTVAFFAASAARDLEPRLVLAGWRRSTLVVGRLVGLLALVGGLTALFGVLAPGPRRCRSGPRENWAPSPWTDPTLGRLFTGSPTPARSSLSAPPSSLLVHGPAGQHDAPPRASGNFVAVAGRRSRGVPEQVVEALDRRLPQNKASPR